MNRNGNPNAGAILLFDSGLTLHPGLAVGLAEASYTEAARIIVGCFGFVAGARASLAFVVRLSRQTELIDVSRNQDIQDVDKSLDL